MSVLRGRVTKAQRRALDELLDKYQLDAPVEAGAAPLGVEIGFGMGDALLDWAQARPDWRIVGIEIYPSGVGAALKRIEELELDNVRLAFAAAEEVLETLIPAGAVQEFRVLFPDPWPKKRHHKRRLLQPGFVSELANRLVAGGSLRVATDWAPYAEWALEILRGEPQLKNTAEGYSQDSDWRRTTKFEQRGLRLGHDIYDLHFTRVES